LSYGQGKTALSRHINYAGNCTGALKVTLVQYQEPIYKYQERIFPLKNEKEVKECETINPEKQ